MNRTVKRLIFVETIFLFGFGLFGPIYAIFVEKIGGNILDVGIAYFIFLVCMATFELPMGKLADKYGRKWFLAFAYFLAGLTFLGYIFVENIYHIFFLQVLYGATLAIGDPAWDAWFSRSLDRSKESFEWALFHMSTGYAEAISALIGGAIGYFIGFKTLFVISAGLAIVSGIVTLGLKDFKIEGPKHHVFHRRHLCKRRFVKKIKRG
ncbi:MAG: MFS transporter [archaeon]